MKILSPQTFIPFVILTVSLVSGCGFTKHDTYDGSREDKIDECNRLPYGQREVCLEHVHDEHEDNKRNKAEPEED